MKVTKGMNPVVRAVGVFSAVAIVAGGVTYAALQSTATLSDNTISSATSTLQVDNLEGGGGYGASDVGFQFTGLIPGADYSSAQQFKLKNNGDTHLFVNVNATAGTETGTLDESKVFVKFTNKSLSTPGSVEYTLAQLQADQHGLPGLVGDDFLDNLGEQNEFDVQVKLAEDAVSGSASASVADFDLVFTGTPVTSQPVESVNRGGDDS